MNTTTLTQNVIITDDVLPTITCPADVTLNANTPSCELSFVKVYDIPFAQISGMSSGVWCGVGGTEALTCGGTFSFTWNSVSSTQPDNIVLEFYQGYNDNAPLTLDFNGISNNNYFGPNIFCSPYLYSMNLNPANFISNSVNTVTIYSPACLLFAENPDPAWTPGSFIRVIEKVFADIGTPIVADNCSIASITNDAIDTYSIGTHTIQWTVTDNAGNTATCDQQITVVDGTAPVADLLVLDDITAECEVSSLIAPTATDNCSPTVTVTNDAVLPITAQGTTVVTWTYDDGNGNTSTQTQNVVLNDITLPVADALSLSDLVADCEISSWVAPTATDDCVGTITGIANVSLPVQSSTTITWSFEDENGNITTQTQQVIINVATLCANVQT
jgi:hypothetical protein